MNDLRNKKSPEANDVLWALANGHLPIINIYSGCISNGVRFHTFERDNRHKSQNSGLAVEGEHAEQTSTFYGYLCKVWEISYLFNHRVVLFQCEWFNTGNNRTYRVDEHCTSIDIRSRWYKDDPFVLPSQVQQVFYVNDTKLGVNWKIVQRFHHRGIWDVPELEEEEPNDVADSVLNEVYQQDEVDRIIPIVVEDTTPVLLHRNDIEAEIIHREGINVNDGFICDDEDELMEDLDDEEEEELNYFDTDVDIEL